MEQQPPIVDSTQRNTDYIYSNTAANVAKASYKPFIIKVVVISCIVVVFVAVGVVVVKKYFFDEDIDDCAEGFFHANDAEDEICYPCTIRNCKKCEGDIDNNKCKECVSGATIEYNEKNEIKFCIGTEPVDESNDEEDFECPEHCRECDKIRRRCLNCESGYFVPDDNNNKLNCEKCSLTNCDKCEGTKNNDACILCETIFIPKYDNENKIKYCNDICQTGDYENCKECDFQNNKCSSCNSGYYLPSDDDIKLECKSCSLSHCKICHGTKTSNICDQCDENYDPVLDDSTIKECKLHEEEVVITCEKGEGSKCLTCSETEPSKCGSCNPSYKLVDGKCELESVEETDKTVETEKKVETDKAIETEKKVETDKTVEPDDESEDQLDYDYISFTAYYSAKANQRIGIIYKTKKDYILKLVVDGVSKNPKNDIDSEGRILFGNSNGVHSVKIWLDIYNYVLQNLFYSIENLVSITVDSVKNTEQIYIMSMKNMFNNCTSLTSVDLSKLTTEDVNSIETIFLGCYSLKSLDLSKNNFQNVKNGFGAFGHCSSLTSINLNSPFPNLEIFDNSFYNASSLTTVDLSKMNLGKLKTIYGIFEYCYNLVSVNLGNVNTAQIENMRSMFAHNHKLTSVDLSKFNTQKVKDLSRMFESCASLKRLDLSSFDTSEVTNMRIMFYNTTSLTSLNFGNNFNTAKVTDMSYMFGTTGLLKLDLRHFNTGNVNNMAYMFDFSQKLTSVDVSSFDTSKVTNFYRIFYACTSLTSINLANFDFTESEKKYTSPPLIQFCQSLKYIDITSIGFIFRDFFDGIPYNNRGFIRARRKLTNNLLSMGIRVLLSWDWEIVG